MLPTLRRERARVSKDAQKRAGSTSKQISPNLPALALRATNARQRTFTQRDAHALVHWEKRKRNKKREVKQRYAAIRDNFEKRSLGIQLEKLQREVAADDIEYLKQQRKQRWKYYIVTEPTRQQSLSWLEEEQAIEQIRKNEKAWVAGADQRWLTKTMQDVHDVETKLKQKEEAKAERWRREKIEFEQAVAKRKKEYEENLRQKAKEEAEMEQIVKQQTLKRQEKIQAIQKETLRVASIIAAVNCAS